MQTSQPKNRLRNCPVCGRLFTDTGLGICPHCYDKRRESEKLVIQYVKEHPNATIRQVCQETEASYELVKEMIRRDQFIAIGGHVTYPCSTCGKPIMRGTQCPQCLAKLRKEIQDVNERCQLKMHAAGSRRPATKESSVGSHQPASDGKRKLHLHWIPGSERDL